MSHFGQYLFSASSSNCNSDLQLEKEFVNLIGVTDLNLDPGLVVVPLEGDLNGCTGIRCGCGFTFGAGVTFGVDDAVDAGVLLKPLIKGFGVLGF